MTSAAIAAGSCRICSLLLFGSCLVATVLEISDIPAGAGQLKARRRQLLSECSLTTFRAIRQVRLTHLAHDFLAKTTTCALIIIDWHVVKLRTSKKNGIIPEMYMAIKGEISSV